MASENVIGYFAIEMWEEFPVRVPFICSRSLTGAVVAMSATPQRHEGAATIASPSRLQRFLFGIFNALLPAIVFIALIAAWWAAVAILKVPAFLLPPPEDVLPRIVADHR